jgi:hypothetical protein
MVKFQLNVSCSCLFQVFHNLVPLFVCVLFQAEVEKRSAENTGGGPIDVAEDKPEAVV